MTLFLTDYKTAFSIYDRDGKGTIDRNELLHVMRPLGENPTEEQMAIIMQEVGSNLLALKLFIRRIHCVKRVRIPSHFGPYFSLIRTEYGKIRTSITPNTDTFYVVIFLTLTDIVFLANCISQSLLKYRFIRYLGSRNTF